MIRRIRTAKADLEVGCAPDSSCGSPLRALRGGVVAVLRRRGRLLIAPPVLRAVTAPVDAVFPVSAIRLLSLVFVFLVLIYFSHQLTILSNRITAIAQAIALREIESHMMDPKHSPSEVTTARDQID